MFVNVKTEKRQQTNECHLSLLLSAMQLNKVKRLSVAQEKTCFNSSRGGLDDLFITPRRCVSKGDYQQKRGIRSEVKIPTGKLFGLKKFDLVKTSKGVGFVKGKRSLGFFAISDIHGTIISDSVNIKKNIGRIQARKAILTWSRNSSLT